MLNQKVLLYYDASINNFGDILNSILIPQIFNFNVILANKKNCEMIAIGSLLGRFLTNHFSLLSLLRKPILVWGGGVC